jgi:hypothetical protein
MMFEMITGESKIRWEAYKAFVWVVFMLLVSISFVVTFWMATFSIVHFSTALGWGVLFLIGLLLSGPDKSREKNVSYNEANKTQTMNRD